MDVDALIVSVFKRPPIWDKRGKLYSNRTAVDRCWKEISVELRSEEALARKKWKYLRDNFAVEYGKTLQSRSGDAANTCAPSKWQYFRKLMFLKDIVTPRASSGLFNSSSNFQTADTDQREEIEHDFGAQENALDDISTDDSHGQFKEFKAEVEEVQELQPEQQESQSSSTCITNTLVESAPVPSVNKRKRNPSMDYYSKLLEIEERNAQCLHSEPKRLVTDEEDTDLMFFKTLLPHVRLIPQRMKLQFQSQIQSVVQEYAYTTPSNERAPSAHHTYRSFSPSPSNSPSQSTSRFDETRRQIDRWNKQV